MTTEQMNECADRLEVKAEDVREGAYDPSEPGENESWMGDLLHAAYLLREGRIADLNQSEREEIEAIGYDLTEEEHPDTDEHRADCTHCMYVHDKNLPDAS